MKSKAVALFLSLSLATTLIACDASTTYEGGEEGGTEPTPMDEGGEEGGTEPTPMDEGGEEGGTEPTPLDEGGEEGG